MAFTFYYKLFFSQGIRDAALDLLHILVAVHAEVSISTFPLIIKIVHLSFALDVHQLLINHKFTSIALTYFLL